MPKYTVTMERSADVRLDLIVEADSPEEAEAKAKVTRDHEDMLDFLMFEPSEHALDGYKSTKDAGCDDVRTASVSLHDGPWTMLDLAEPDDEDEAKPTPNQEYSAEMRMLESRYDGPIPPAEIKRVEDKYRSTLADDDAAVTS